MSWGKGIIVTYVLFISMILFIVISAVRQNISLVEEDYYKEEISYQAQIERIRNANKEENKLEFIYNTENKQLTLKYAPKHVSAGLIGELKLFRPDDSKADQSFVMNGDSTKQVLSLAKLKGGLWKMKAKWKSKGEEYYKEESLFL